MFNDKEHFDFLVRNEILKDSDYENRVIKLVDFLIDALYIPVGDGKRKAVDPERLRLFKIGNEPINWGDLSCLSVKRFDDGSILVTINEASPGGCPAFCAYIEKYLKANGWWAEVQTEW